MTVEICGLMLNRYFVTVVEAWAPANASALIILGDSITDGRGSDDDKNNRFVHHSPFVITHTNRPTAGPTSYWHACKRTVSRTSV